MKQIKKELLVAVVFILATIAYTQNATIVSYGEKSGLRKGTSEEMLLPYNYYSIISRGNYFIVTDTDLKMGVCDTMGKFVIPCKYRDIRSSVYYYCLSKNPESQQNFYIQDDNYNWGIINSEGKTIIPIEFYFIGEITDNKTIYVCKQNKWGFYNLNGVLIEKLKKLKTKEETYLIESLNTFSCSGQFLPEKRYLIFNGQRYDYLSKRGKPKEDKLDYSRSRNSWNILNQ